MVSIEELLEIMEDLRKQINSLRKQINENNSENVPETSSVDFRNFFPENINIVSEIIEKNEDNIKTKKDREKQLENDVVVDSSVSDKFNFTNSEILPISNIQVDGQRAKILTFENQNNKSEFLVLTPETNEFGVRIRSREEINEKVENFEERTSTRTEEIFGNEINDDTVYQITGTDIRDIIHGDERNEVIRGGDGNDQLIGLRGDDVLFGGNGNDNLFGGPGNDVFIPGNGDFFDFTSDNIEDGESITDNMDLVNGGDTSTEKGFDTTILRGTQDDWDFNFDDNDFINAQSNSLDQSVKLVGINEIQFVDSSQKIDTETL